MRRRISVFALALCLLPFGPRLLAQAPHLEQRGDSTQLIVDGKPFLMLAGELSNSSSSSLAYMQPIWPRLAAAGLN